MQEAAARRTQRLAAPSGMESRSGRALVAVKAKRAKLPVWRQKMGQKRRRFLPGLVRSGLAASWPAARPFVSPGGK